VNSSARRAYEAVLQLARPRHPGADGV